MLYQVTLLKSEEGYSVSCPSLPGCHSQGETKEEALENIKDAITEYKAAVAEMQAASEGQLYEKPKEPPSSGGSC